MTTKTCQTCKHWLTSKESQDHREPVSKEHGRCLAVIQNDSYADNEELVKIIRSPMVVMDGSNYYAALFTLPDHGCNSWGAK